MRKDTYQNCLVLYPENVWNKKVETLQANLDEWNFEDQMLLSQFVSDAEWLAAKKSLIGGFRQMTDSTRSLVRYYELRALLGIEQTLEQSIERFVALTREDVIAVAQKLRLELVYFRRGMGGAEEMGEEDASDD